jgi:hypothetical protein
MIKRQLQHNNPNDQTSPQTPHSMRWFFLIMVLIWLLISLIVTGLTISFTKSLLSLSVFATLAPPTYLLYWIAKHIFPMDERTYKLKELKIRSSVVKQQYKKKP